MPKFRYLAYDISGKNQKGAVEAPNFQAAIGMLSSQGLWVAKMFDESQSFLHRNLLFQTRPKVKTKHFAVFCRQLATMYKVGTDLLEAVRILSEQSESKVLRKILGSVAKEMKKGTSFSTAAAAHSDVFSPVFTYAVRAGEAGGHLDEMLERLAVFYEKEHDTREKIKTAMIYPALMTVLTVLVVTFMMIFVIPRYVQNYESMNLQLPLLTRMVMKLSEGMQSFWYLVPAAFFLPGAARWLMKKHRRSRHLLDTYKLKFPLFGSLWHKQAIARFSRTFSSLFSAAVPLPETMDIASRVVSNEVLRKQILEARKEVLNGQPIADALKGSPWFPPMLIHMLAIGDKTGTLDQLLDKVADYYEADVDILAERLRSYLEPMMILVLSIIVGGIVVAVMLPSFGLMRGI